MQEKLVLVVSLWLRDGDVEAFEEFERRAVRLMARHGGAIERAIRIGSDTPDDPFEIHIVTFPDREAFAAYRNDPETRGLAGLRERIIARTEIREGREVDSGY